MEQHSHSGDVSIPHGNGMKCNFSCRTSSVCDLLPQTRREVFFETNGLPRAVEIVDRTDQAEGGGPIRKAAREKADPDVLGSVGAPMAGEVIEVTAKPGGWPQTMHRPHQLAAFSCCVCGFMLKTVLHLPAATETV